MPMGSRNLYRVRASGTTLRWQGHGHGSSDSGGQSPIGAQLYASARHRHPAKSSDESHIFDAMAKAFGIKDWPVAAIKAYLVTTRVCIGDQIIASLVFGRMG